MNYHQQLCFLNKENKVSEIITQPTDTFGVFFKWRCENSLPVHLFSTGSCKHIQYNTEEGALVQSDGSLLGAKASSASPSAQCYLQLSSAKLDIKHAKAG